MTMRAVMGGALLVVAGLLGGCGQSLRSQTADQIHCPPNDTQIFNSHSEMDREMWIATCTGRRTEYACSKDKSGGDQVTCAPTEGN